MLYFDVFNYPLSKDEIYQNSAITISCEEFELELKELLNQQLLKEEEGFILSQDRTTLDVTRRLHGNEGARRIMNTAYRYSHKIASFPFVEGLALSGSISKNYYDKDGDIDFFVITKPNRLWICRTLLMLRYKTLSPRKKKFWCTNYFISSNNLRIPDINAFTGTELAYLVPTVNYNLYKKILDQNNWYRKKYPNKPEASTATCIVTPTPVVKTIIQSLLKGKFGDWLDDRLLRFTLNHWRRKYPSMNKEDFELQFRSRKDVCKRHTHGFQNKILIMWKQKTADFEKRFNVSLK